MTAPASTRARLAGRAAALAVLYAWVASLWVVEAYNVLLEGRLDRDGVHPRDVGAVWQILTAPMLHASWSHLVGNTVPLLVLGTVVALGGLRVFLTVTAIAWLLSGTTAWLLGQSHTVHLGASGVVFGYIFFVVLRGLYTRRPLDLVVGLAAALYYGLGAVAGLSPLQHGVSWQGHVGGAIGGVLSASRGRRTPAPPAAGGLPR